MPVWEYCKIYLNDAPPRMDEIDLLNRAGKEGWEVVGVTNNNVAYLKRQIVEPAPARELPPARATGRKSVSRASA